MNIRICSRLFNQSAFYAVYFSRMVQAAHITPILDLQIDDRMKTIEEVVYRQWIAKRPNDSTPHGRSCLLLDVHISTTLYMLLIKNCYFTNMKCLIDLITKT